MLPKNERSSRRNTPNNNTELQNTGNEHPQTHIVIEPEWAEKKVEHFPIFMIGISVVQVIKNEVNI